MTEDESDDNEDVDAYVMYPFMNVDLHIYMCVYVCICILYLATVSLCLYVFNVL